MLDKIDFQAWRLALVTILCGVSQEQDDAAADAYGGVYKRHFDRPQGRIR
jgi:hypothetical protein